MKVKVHSLVGEGGEFIAEAELKCAVSRRCERKAVVLFLHLLIEDSAIRVLETTVNIIVSSCHHLHRKHTHTVTRDPSLNSDGISFSSFTWNSRVHLVPMMMSS